MWSITVYILENKPDPQGEVMELHSHQDSSPNTGELICCFEELCLRVKSRPPQRVKNPKCRGQTLAVTESSYGFIKAQGISRVGIKTKGFSCCEKIIKITFYCEASCVVL